LKRPGPDVGCHAIEEEEENHHCPTLQLNKFTLFILKSLKISDIQA
jgi:hypothetical protein